MNSETGSGSIDAAHIVLVSSGLYKRDLDLSLFRVKSLTYTICILE